MPPQHPRSSKHSMIGRNADAHTGEIALSVLREKQWKPCPRRPKGQSV
jgi:hypothetical protein